MYLYRIEHYESHNGPYRHHTLAGNIQPHALIKMCDIHSDDSHPSMRDEFQHIIPERMIKDYYCGFTSAEKCAEWFKGFLKTLRGFEFIIAVYTCSDVHHGAIQSVFRMSVATRVDELPIDILL